MLMKIAQHILISIFAGIWALTSFSAPVQVQEQKVVEKEVLLPLLKIESDFDAYAYPMTLVGETVYYAVDYLVPQSNDVKKSEIYAQRIDGDEHEVIYSAEFDASEAGGISELNASKDCLFFVEVNASWIIYGLDIETKETFVVRDSAQSKQQSPPSIQVIDEHVYWFETDEDGASVLYKYNMESKEVTNVSSDVPFYLASPYKVIPASEKDIFYLTKDAESVFLNRLSDGNEVPHTIDTTLDSVELVAVSDKYAFFANRALDPALYLMKLDTGNVAVVLDEVEIGSVRSAVIVDDLVLIDLSIGNHTAVFQWQVGSQTILQIADEAAWLRKTGDGKIIGVMPDSDIDPEKHIAGMRIIELGNDR